MAPPDRHESPCQSCGACCATFRVTFHEEELSGHATGTVPDGMTEGWTGSTVMMRGTGRQPPRCIALQGQVGTSVNCSIYAQRPSPCREFAPLASLGRGDEACDEARRRHGLAPLRILERA